MGPLIALLSAALLVAVDATPNPERHAVSGRFALPRTFVRSSAATAASPNAIANGGFESGSINNGWLQCGDVSVYVLRAHPYSGMYDEFSGVRDGGGEPRGNSGVCQRVTIPPAGLLSVQLYQLSNEAGTAYAYQEADLLDDRGNLIVNLYRSVNDQPAWVRGKWNLGAYGGRTLWLYFGVHGDGYRNRSTQQYVDDVTLTSANPAAPK